MVMPPDMSQRQKDRWTQSDPEALCCVPSIRIAGKKFVHSVLHINVVENER
jgi:hypothetical protein